MGYAMNWMSNSGKYQTPKEYEEIRKSVVESMKAPEIHFTENVIQKNLCLECQKPS